MLKKRTYKLLTLAIIIISMLGLTSLIQAQNPPVPINWIDNGNFGGGSYAWYEYSDNHSTLIVNQEARLGAANNEFSYLSQSVTDIVLSPGFGSPLTLRFDYFIESADYCGYDTADILVWVDGTTYTLKTYDLCQTNNSSGWVTETFDLTEHINATEIQVIFRTITDYSYVSEFYVDNVVLETLMYP